MLLLAWFVAVLIRLATGSATVATVTASGILAPLVTTLDPAQTSLLVLAIGAGSLFFSHVNDAGFWLVKEYFGLTVGQTIKTWSIMETHHLGRRPGVRPAAQPRGLTRPTVPTARDLPGSGPCGRSNSPSLTPSTNASHSDAVNTRTGPSGSRELRSGTVVAQKRTSTQLLYWLLLLFRHALSFAQVLRFAGHRVSDLRLATIGGHLQMHLPCRKPRSRPRTGVPVIRVSTSRRFPLGLAAGTAIRACQ